MNTFGRILIAAATMSVVGCGDATRKVTVELSASTLEMIDPYQPSANLERVRITVDGPDSNDDATRDLTPDQRSTTFEDIPDGVLIDVRAEGLDEVGNIVAFGRKIAVDEEGDITVSFALRRNVAYVTHFDDPEAMSPASQLYVIDIASRTYLGKVALPGAGAVGRGVTARDGASVLVTYDEGGQGRLGILDASAHTWRTINLPAVQDLALAVASSPIAVVAGGNIVTFVNVETGEMVEQFSSQVGGRVLDGAIAANGKNAIFILDRDPGGAIVNLDTRDVRPLNVTVAAAGVALRADGRLAYVTSSEVPGVVAVELANGRTAAFAGFTTTAGPAAYSEANNAVMSLRGLESGLAQVVSWFFEDDSATDPEEGQRTLMNPTDIVADGSGQRIVIIASGEGDSPPGMTVLDTRPGEAPVGSNALYPTDPDDTYVEGASGVIINRRYRPRSIGIIYGR